MAGKRTTFSDNRRNRAVVGPCMGQSEERKGPTCKPPCVSLSCLNVHTLTPRACAVHMSRAQWKELRRIVDAYFRDAGGE